MIALTIGVLLGLCLLFLFYVIFYIVQNKARKTALYYAFISFLISILYLVGTNIADFIYYFIQGKDIDIIQRLSYIGTILIPVGFCFTGIAFMKNTVNLKHVLLSLIIPIISIIVVLTNTYHHAFVKVFSHSSNEIRWGWYFYVHYIYSYLIICIGVYHFIKKTDSSIRRKQVAFILIAAFVAMAVNTTFCFTQIFKINYPFDPTAVIFIFTISLFWISMIKYNFLDIYSLAWKKLFDNDSDALLIVDSYCNIIDYNESFKQKLLNYRDIIINNTSNIEQLQTNLEMQIDELDYIIDINPIFNNKHHIGSAIRIKEITDFKKNIQLLAEHERLVLIGQLATSMSHTLRTQIMTIDLSQKHISNTLLDLHNIIKSLNLSSHSSDLIESKFYECTASQNLTLSCLKYVEETLNSIKLYSVNDNPDTFTTNEIVEKIKGLMMYKDLNISNNADMEELKGSMNFLTQAINNLINNAKHAYNGNPGVINLDIYKQDGNIIFSVRDFGQGIPKEVQDKLFKQMITTKGKEGSGIGLYFSQKLIKSQFGGDMRFESEEGKGTTFYIKIPVHQISETSGS